MLKHFQPLCLLHIHHRAVYTGTMARTMERTMEKST